MKAYSGCASRPDTSLSFSGSFIFPTFESGCPTGWSTNTDIDGNYPVTTATYGNIVNSTFDSHSHNFSAGLSVSGVLPGDFVELEYLMAGSRT